MKPLLGAGGVSSQLKAMELQRASPSCCYRQASKPATTKLHNGEMNLDFFEHVHVCQRLCEPAGRVVTAEKERKGKQPSLPPPRTPTTATCPSTLLISHTYTFKQALRHPLSAAVKHTSRTRQSERAGSKPRLQTCTESSARVQTQTRTHTHLLTIISS